MSHQPKKGQPDANPQHGFIPNLSTRDTDEEGGGCVRAPCGIRLPAQAGRPQKMGAALPQACWLMLPGSHGLLAGLGGSSFPLLLRVENFCTQHRQEDSEQQGRVLFPRLSTLSCFCHILYSQPALLLPEKPHEPQFLKKRSSSHSLCIQKTPVPCLWLGKSAIPAAAACH